MYCTVFTNCTLYMNIYLDLIPKIASITKLRYSAQNTFGQLNNKIIGRSLIRLQEVSTPPLFRYPAHYSSPVSAATAYRRRYSDDLRAVFGRPAATAQNGWSALAT